MDRLCLLFTLLVACSSPAPTVEQPAPPAPASTPSGQGGEPSGPPQQAFVPPYPTPAPGELGTNPWPPSSAKLPYTLEPKR